MVRINATITPDWLRAVARAAEDRAAGRVPVRVACRKYRIPSTRAGQPAHTVVIDSLVNLQASCDCEAGSRGLKCRHQAAALCEAARHIARCETERATAPLPAPVATSERQQEVRSLMARFARQ